MTVEEEYMTYPAHTSSSPDLRAFNTHFSMASSTESPSVITHSPDE